MPLSILQLLCTLFNFSLGSTLQETIVCVLSSSYFIVAYILKLLAWLMYSCFWNDLCIYLQTIEEKPVTFSKAWRPHCSLDAFPPFPFTFCIFFFSRQTILQSIRFGKDLWYSENILLISQTGLQLVRINVCFGICGFPFKELRVSQVPWWKLKFCIVIYQQYHLIPFSKFSRLMSTR